MSVSVFSGVDPGDPSLQLAGDVEIRVDGDGRLRTLVAVPTTSSSSRVTSPAPDWPSLFAEAGLDITRWAPVEPRSIPSFYADTRAAWQGSLPDAPAVPVRIEAAAFQGRPITFDIVGPWTSQSPGIALRSGPVFLTDFTSFLGLAVVVVILVGGGLFFARQNLRIGRGDRRGATRLMLLVLATWSIAWMLIEHHVAAVGEGLLYVVAAGAFCSAVGLLWLFYIAVEPFVRRRWPHMLVSWTRALSGDWRDPLVGRDVLIGCAAGVASMCLFDVGRLVISWQGREALPITPDWNMFNGTSPFVGALLGQFASGIFVGLAELFVLFLFRVVLRRDWAAAALYVLMTGSDLYWFAPSWVNVPLAVVSGLLAVVVLMRIGLVANVILFFLSNVFLLSPMTLNTSVWYASAGYVAFLVVVAIALYGFKTSLGGRPLLAGAGVED